jgi:hypothetical protein
MREEERGGRERRVGEREERKGGRKERKNFPPTNWNSWMLTRTVDTYLEKSRETPSEWQYTVWKSHENERQRMAPKKNNPNTTFSCRGATKEIFGRNI